MKSLCTLMRHYLPVLFGPSARRSIIEQTPAYLSNFLINDKALGRAEVGATPRLFNQMAAYRQLIF